MGQQHPDVLVMGRRPQGAPGVKTLDLRRYSHLDLFTSTEAPAKYRAVQLSVEENDRDNLRPVLRDIDWGLAVGGRVEVRGRGAMDWVLFALHVVFGARFSITDLSTHFVCVKERANPAHAIDNRLWSLGVVSGGNNESRLERLIASIERQAIPDVELLIVGPAPRLALPPWCRHVAFEEHPRDPRFAIAAKKNAVAAEAKHENLLILHDRYRLADDWYRAILALRPGWEVLVLPAVREGQPNGTLDDWVAFRSQGATREQYRLAQYQLSYPADFSRLDHLTLPYERYSERITVNGGAFAVKRELLRTVPLDPRLHWGEIEDGDWSERLVNHGVVISLAHGARVENLPSDPHAASPKGWIASLKAPYISTRRAVRAAAFRTIRETAQRLGQRSDLFRSRGCFSNDVALLSADDLLRKPALNWPSKPAVFVRGDFERRLDLRAVLEQIRRYCPAGGEVYLELATNGVGYYTRGSGVRNCEVLMYEVGLVLGDDFELRSIFCSTELSFLVHLTRVRRDAPNAITQLLVVADDEAWADNEHATFDAFAADWRRVAPPVAAAEGEGAVLLLRDARALGKADCWLAAYRVAGFVSQRATPDARLLDGNMLCSYRQWSELVDGRALDPRNSHDAQRAEIAAILRGRWPAVLATDGSFR